MRNPLAVLLVTASLCYTMPMPALGQGTVVGTPLDDYARLLQLTGALPPSASSIRPRLESRLLDSLKADRPNPWGAGLASGSPATTNGGLRFEATPIEGRVFENTNRPWGVNDGAIWQGKGATLALSAGGRVRWKALSVGFQPGVTYNQNDAFTLSPFSPSTTTTTLSPYAYPTLGGQVIDSPQRFGPDAYSTFDLGQSYARIDWRGTALGLSNENLWWGPGVRNSIVMTNHAGGFPHLFLGTSGPARLGRFATFEARWIWGQLRESEWFDSVQTNDRRFLTGLVVSVSPASIPGLQFGGARTFTADWSRADADFFRIFAPFQKVKQVSDSNEFGDDEQDQLASLFVRWTLPESGFEIYGEWGKGDHSWDFRDLLLEPEHASGYLLGVQKAFKQAPNRAWRFTGEMIFLGGPRTAAARSAEATFFYLHHKIKQGYTQRGQILGAGIGPGSNQQYVGLDRFARWGKFGFAIQRTGYDNDRFLRQLAPYRNYMEVEPALLGDVLIFRGPWDLTASASIAKLMNQYYILRNDQTNVNLSVGARYNFSRGAFARGR